MFECVCGWQTGSWLVRLGFILVSSWVLSSHHCGVYSRLFPEGSFGCSAGEVVLIILCPSRFQRL